MTRVGAPQTNPVTVELLEAAYRQGVFPMGDPETGDLAWYRPEPRTIIDLEGFHVSRRLGKTIRGGKFRFTVDQAFDEVIRRCARRESFRECWITPEIVDLYSRFHRCGKAHSVEAWVGGDAAEPCAAGGELAGGLYGVALGGAFMGESMFHAERDASKACLVYLVERLKSRGYVLLDTQFPTPHLARFGILILPHREYLARLDEALKRDCSFA